MYNLFTFFPLSDSYERVNRLRFTGRSFIIQPHTNFVQYNLKVCSLYSVIYEHIKHANYIKQNQSVENQNSWQ